MYTCIELLSRIRDNLDEQTPGQWSQQQLRRFINDGLDDLSRSTKHLQDIKTITTIAGTAEYAVSKDVLMIMHAYWVTSDGRYLPLAPVQYEGADQVWGQYQTQQSTEPFLFTTWGYAPNLKMRLYPVPSTTGSTVSLRVIRLAAHVDINGLDGDTSVDCPEAWLDALTYYAEFRALRKDRDPRWQEAYQLYTSIRDSLADEDYLNANREIVYDPATIGGVPRWIADPRWS
jgi:hypothetical protein